MGAIAAVAGVEPLLLLFFAAVLLVGALNLEGVE